MRFKRRTMYWRYKRQHGFMMWIFRGIKTPEAHGFDFAQTPDPIYEYHAHDFKPVG